MNSFIVGLMGLLVASAVYGADAEAVRRCVRRLQMNTAKTLAYCDPKGALRMDGVVIQTLMDLTREMEEALRAPGVDDAVREVMLSQCEQGLAATRATRLRCCQAYRKRGLLTEDQFADCARVE